MVVIYLLLISFFLFAYYGGYINSEQLFIGLNIIFSLYIGLLICKQLKKGMSIINPIIVTSIFMFLLPYGFPVLFQYSNGEIRYYPTYISLAKSMLYVNAGFITLWYSYKSLLFNPILYSLKKYSKLFVHKLVVKKTYTYFFLLSSIILNFRSIYSGSYGVLATIYADNKESYFKVSYVPIINTEAEKGEPHKLGDVILLKNITEFKELDSAKTTFISTISHELKTPIAAIMMSLQLLEDKRVGALNDEQEQLSKSIKENSERLLSITGELLNMTQVEAGKLQLMPKITKPIELIEYAIKANQVQADKFNIQIEVEYPEEKIGKLFVDSEKIAWVLTNLLSNAIRYSKENGHVVIGAKQDENWIELYVQDFGKGIDPRYHKSIFDRYFRVPGTKVQGSGLGLSISKDFVEAHGGTLTVESELGKGSRFVMRLKA